SWADEVGGRWFWLDSNRNQSRVLLRDGLTLDFSPLRAPTIIEDLQLRDFTINSLALPLTTSFPSTELLDPLGGIDHLQQKRLLPCSPRSFADDPLRMLKGIRHAVTLDFVLTEEIQREMRYSAHLLNRVAGERIQDELSKILATENVVKGLELLLDTGLLGVLFGPAGCNWNRQAAINEIMNLNAKIQVTGLTTAIFSDLARSETFPNRSVFLLSCLLKHYSPEDLSDLLHNRLRLSRTLQRLLMELWTGLNSEFLFLASSIEGQRRQALLVEQVEPYACEKLLYWGVCYDHLGLNRVLELHKSFSEEQKLGRIPDLLNGRLIASLLDDSANTQIGEWQLKLKQAEINGEIGTAIEARNWLENKLSFDNQEP
ncbi:MAG: CCA tRNA nucleotidyltransferase, partial [Desulfuromusa sp.]|nr:CCA tRNA nucleotidyltransferase [Desulfuromusa sp.]